MRTAVVALLALCIGCALIMPIEEIAPVVANDALERLPQAGRRQIAIGGIDFPLLATAVFAESNRERRKHDLPSLAYLPALETISKLHASFMVLHRSFNHINQVDSYRRTVADRLDLVDLPASFYRHGRIGLARLFPISGHWPLYRGLRNIRHRT